MTCAHRCCAAALARPEPRSVWVARRRGAQL